MQAAFRLLWVLVGSLLCFGLGLATVRGEEETDRGQFVDVTLTVGRRTVRIYPAREPARAVILFGSGDGGWSYFERRCCHHLADVGCLVIGIDCNRYATDATYDLPQLAQDLATLSELGRQKAAQPAAPVLWGGWSMGAEQSVPAAAYWLEKDPAKAPRGLLLVAPGERGRFGLHTQDRLGVKPTGPGTYGLPDYAEKLKPLRVAQFHPSLDLLDHTAWLDRVTTEHQLWVLGKAVHNFAGVSPEFLAQVDDALNWLLAAPESAAAPTQLYSQSWDRQLIGWTLGVILFLAGLIGWWIRRRRRKKATWPAPNVV